MSWIVVLGIVAWSSIAAAHRFEHPKVLRIGVQADQIVVAATYDVNPGADALRTRALFDRNTDGTLDRDERAKLERYLIQTATLWLKLTVDGASVELGPPAVTPNRLDRPADDATTLGIAMLWTVPRPPGPRVRIHLADRDKDREKHVPVSVDVAGGDGVALATQGEWDPDAKRLLGVHLAADADLTLVLVREP